MMMLTTCSVYIKDQVVYYQIIIMTISYFTQLLRDLNMQQFFGRALNTYIHVHSIYALYHSCLNGSSLVYVTKL